MARQASAHLDLGRFNVTPNAIERLASDIAALGGQRHIHLESIDVTTKNSLLAYKSVEQVRSDAVRNKRSTKLRLVFCEVGESDRPGARSIRIMGGEGTDNRIEVYGDEEDWVVGMGQNVRKLMKAHEVWHRHITHRLLVRIVYPILACVLLAYAISYGVGIPISAMFGGVSATDYYHRLIVLLPAVPLFVMAYMVPVRSRIVADKPWDQPPSSAGREPGDGE